MYGISNWAPLEEDLKDLYDGTFYLSQIDSEHRRTYSQNDKLKLKRLLLINQIS